MRRCGAREAKARERERARGRARGRGENGECAGAVHRRRGGRGVGERECRPRGVAGLTRSGARGAAVSERGEAGPASLAGPVGWRRPASEQPPFPFF